MEVMKLVDREMEIEIREIEPKYVDFKSFRRVVHSFCRVICQNRDNFS